MQVDFGLLQTPNFAQAALGGYEAGRKIGVQRRRDSALKTLASRPDDDEALGQLAAVDPGAARDFNTMRTERDNARRAATSRQTLADLILADGMNRGAQRNAALGQGGVYRAAPSGPATAPALGGSTAMSTDTGTVAPALGQPQGAPIAAQPLAGASPYQAAAQQIPVDPRADAWTKLVRNDPDRAIKYQEARAKVTKGELDTYQGVNAASLQLLGGVSDQASYDAARQRAAELHDRYGVGIDGFDLPDQYNPQFVEKLMHQALSVRDQLAAVRAERKEAWDIQDDEADNARADRNVDSTIEDRGARRGLIARGQNLTDSRGRRGQDIASGDRRRGQDMTDTRLREHPTKAAGGGRGSSAPTQLKRNPTTGEVVGLVGGKWVPIK